MDERTENRQLDLEGLKALAHPLRVRIVDTLSTYGAFTASGLAERLGESSGATSYHLRQLEKHHFVREVEGKGTGRERWWERVPGGITIPPTETMLGPAGREATRMVLRQWQQQRDVLLNDFLERGDTMLSEEWLKVSTISTANVTLTVDQLHDLRNAWDALCEEYIVKHRGKTPPGSRPVQVHFNAFPVIDGDVIPEEG